MHLKNISETKTALGGDATIFIVTDLNDDEIKNLFDSLWNKIFRFERQYSRFIPSSELSNFNRSAGIKTSVSPDFIDMLNTSKELSLKTNGLFNPFILPALHRTGYVQSAVEKFKDDVQVDYSDRVVVDVNEIKIVENWAEIPFRTAVDFGGFGKGLLADKLSTILENKNIYGYWISLSGDIIAKVKDEKGHKINVNIQDANDLNSVTNYTIEVDAKCGIATSGTFKRPGYNNSGEWHHIIDPSTMKPAKTDIRLATVCADSATEADLFASCAVILGSKKAPEFLKKHNVKSMLLQCIDENNKTFNLSFGDKIKQKVSNA